MVSSLEFQLYFLCILFIFFVLFLLPGKEPDVAAWRVIVFPPTPLVLTNTENLNVYAYMDSNKTAMVSFQNDQNDALLTFGEFFGHIDFPRKQTASLAVYCGFFPANHVQL